MGPVHCPDLPAPLPPSVGGDGLAAAIGAGLMFAAVTNTCAMGNLLARMPWNRTSASCPTVAVSQLTKDR